MNCGNCSVGFNIDKIHKEIEHNKPNGIHHMEVTQRFYNWLLCCYSTPSKDYVGAIWNVAVMINDNLRQDYKFVYNNNITDDWYAGLRVK